MIATMLDHPILVHRPILCSPKGGRLSRPSETVLDLLDRLPPGPIYKENGAMVTCLLKNLADQLAMILIGINYELEDILAEF